MLPLNNCRLKRVNFKDIENNKMFGFILMARGKTLEFYSVSEDETIEWIEALKAFVVLLDLKEEVSIGKLLGKGNSAKVHKCERISNPN